MAKKHGMLVDANDATVQEFITAINDVQTLCPDINLLDIADGVRSKQLRLQQCAGCAGVCYSDASGKDQIHKSLRAIYRLLRFEGFFFRNYQEHIPKQVRKMGAKLIIQMMENVSSSTSVCTLCTHDVRAGSEEFSITYCGHIFHSSCLFRFTTQDDHWNKKHQRQCPNCSELVLCLHPISASPNSTMELPMTPSHEKRQGSYSTSHDSLWRWKNDHNNHDAADLVKRLLLFSQDSDKILQAREIVDTMLAKWHTLIDHSNDIWDQNYIVQRQLDWLEVSVKMTKEGCPSNRDHGAELQALAACLPDDFFWEQDRVSSASEYAQAEL